jgi:hypothetical protein
MHVRSICTLGTNTICSRGSWIRFHEGSKNTLSALSLIHLHFLRTYPVIISPRLTLAGSYLLSSSPLPLSPSLLFLSHARLTRHTLRSYPFPLLLVPPLFLSLSLPFPSLSSFSSPLLFLSSSLHFHFSLYLKSRTSWYLSFFILNLSSPFPLLLSLFLIFSFTILQSNTPVQPHKLGTV